MKVMTGFFILFLICSCHNSSHSYDKRMITKSDEILKIMRTNWIREAETYELKYLSDEEISELQKMKKDYFYVPDPNLNTSLTIPGPGWIIRGPLDVAAVEQSSLDKIKMDIDVPQVPFGYINESWNKLKNQYEEGDELYFFESDSLSWSELRGRSGYVLIRDNKQILKFVTVLN